MNFTQKIYYNNKALILTNSSDAYKAEHPVAEDYLSLTGASGHNFKLAFEYLDKPGTIGAIIEDLSAEALQRELHSIYTPIDAGGGVVVNEDNAVLMIYRRGKWDLPKGKLDEGEDIEACAIREVSEETGLQHLTIIEKVCDTYHVYSQNGMNLLKCTAWYRMNGTLKDTLMPQKEENIQEARWVKEEGLGQIVYKSYDAIREVLQQAGFHWK